MFNIPNFQIIQPLYDSENSSVYRAIRSLDNQPVVLKWLKADSPSATQLARYQQEYELLYSKIDGMNSGLQNRRNEFRTPKSEVKG